VTSDFGYRSRHSERQKAGIALLSGTMGIVVLLLVAAVVDLTATGLSGPWPVEVLKILLVPIMTLVGAMAGFYFARRQSTIPSRDSERS
jgi:hypothetical protein